MTKTTTLATIKHSPDYNDGVLGCRGYAPVGMIALTAGNEGHFLLRGITEGTTVFVQTLYPFQRGKINVYLVNDEEGEHYKLSSEKINGNYIGQAVAAFTDLCG